MAVSERDMVARIRAKAFLGACAVGLASGLLAARAQGGGWVTLVASGVLLVFVAGNIGGFVGMLGRLLWRMVTGGRTDAGGYNAEGVLVLSAYGGFLGLVAALLGDVAELAHFFAAAGAFAGGAIASALGGGLSVLLHLLVLDQMDDPSRSEALRKSATEARRSLLPPDGEDGRD